MIFSAKVRTFDGNVIVGDITASLNFSTLYFLIRSWISQTFWNSENNKENVCFSLLSAN